MPATETPTISAADFMAQHGKPELRAAEARAKQPSEADIQRAIIHALRLLGYGEPRDGADTAGYYWHTSQRRPSGVTIGQPDLTVWRRRDGRSFHFEVKANAKSEVSREQRILADAGCTHIVWEVGQVLALVK